MAVNFELYKVFYYVAKHLSFSEASRQLFISQSAVSQSIKQLETQLQCTLFSRHRKQVQLTREGELLFPHIEQAFHLIKTGEKKIAEIHALIRGEVVIGASDTICKHYLLPFLKKFHQIHPQIKLRIINRSSPACLDLLEKGLVDLSIINIPWKIPFQNISIRKLKTIHDVFIAGEAFFHLKGRRVPLKELGNYPIMMLEKNTVTRDFFEDFQKKNGANIIPEIELGNLNLLVELARIGLGIALVTEEFIQGELAAQDIFIIELEEKMPGRKLGVASRDKVPLSPAARQFLSLLTDFPAG